MVWRAPIPRHRPRELPQSRRHVQPSLASTPRGKHESRRTPPRENHGRHAGRGTGLTASAPLTAHAASAPETADVRLSGVIGNCHPNWVHAYHRQNQPVNRWLDRIVGTDLVKLIGPGRGRISISIPDSDGDDNRSIPFDRHTPPTAIVYINGPHAKIMVSVQAPTGRRRQGPAPARDDPRRGRDGPTPHSRGGFSVGGTLRGDAQRPGCRVRCAPSGAGSGPAQQVRRPLKRARAPAHR